MTLGSLRASILTAGLVSMAFPHAAYCQVPILFEESTVLASDAHSAFAADRELIGETSAPFTLGRKTTTIPITVHAPGHSRLPAGAPKSVLLSLEGLTAKDVPPDFAVYIDLPPDADPEKRQDRFGFEVGTYGLLEASGSDKHPGTGLWIAQDITTLLGHFRDIKELDGRVLHITFVSSSWSKEIPITVRHVSLLAEAAPSRP